MKAPQGFSIAIQDLVSQASGEREQAEVILLSPLNYSQFLNIIKYRSQRNLFLTEDYLRMCSSAIRSIVHNPKSIQLWKYVKLHLLSSLGILLFLIHLDLMETLRKKTTSKCFSAAEQDFFSGQIFVLLVLEFWKFHYGLQQRKTGTANRAEKFAGFIFISRASQLSLVKNNLKFSESIFVVVIHPWKSFFFFFLLSVIAQSPHITMTWLW